MADSIIGKISVGDGATFTPAVSNEGVLSWSNNKNLANPADFDIPGKVLERGVDVLGLAPIASPAFTGTPTAPTPTPGDSSIKIATTAYVQAELQDYLPLSGGTLTGDVFGVTPPNGDNSKKLANTEFIQALANVLVPIGCVQAFAGSTLPDGWLLCDGSAVSRTDYADLYAVIGDTYGAGDGSTTFNLPDLVDKFVEGSATAGTEKTAGLPNITGTFNVRVKNGGYFAAAGDETNGAFYGVESNIASSVDGAMTGVQTGFTRTFGFDASRSSNVYGNSTTVQPPALTMRYIIKY